LTTDRDVSVCRSTYCSDSSRMLQNLYRGR